VTIKESDPTIPPELQKMTESSDTSIDAVIFRFDSKIVVALRSEACFAVPKSSVQSVQRLSDTRLSFELETLLPIDAEEMAVRRVNDLIVVTNKSIAQSIVDTEEDQGKWIGGVSPLVFLALEEWISCTNKSQLALPSAYQILWMSDQLDYSDLVSISNGMPCQWTVLDNRRLEQELATYLLAPSSLQASNHRNNGSNPEPLALDTGSDTAIIQRIAPVANQKIPLLILGKPPHDFDSVLKSLPVIVHEPEASQHEFAERYSKRWIDGSVAPWCDLRGGSLRTRAPLAPLARSLTLLALTSCVVVGLVFGWLVWDGFAIQGRLKASEQMQEEAFRELFPKQSLPTDIAGRLKSEHRKLLAGLTEIDKAPPINSSLPILVRFLETLPDQAIFRIDGIRVISSEIIAIDGAVKTLQDFETLVSTLRSKGFRFATPNIQQMVDGFTLRLERIKFDDSNVTSIGPTNESPEILGARPDSQLGHNRPDKFEWNTTQSTRERGRVFERIH
jgi:hypothetical protein